MTNIASAKRMAAHLLKCGVNRVRTKPGKEVEEALTRQDVRNLIRKGMIYKLPIHGSSRAAARKILAQKRKGRRKGYGSRKGKEGALMPSRQAWLSKVRPLRRLIRQYRDEARLERRDYRRLYKMVKGGTFRNVKHMLLYINEHGMLRAPSKPAASEKKARAGRKESVASRRREVQAAASHGKQGNIAKKRDAKDPGMIESIREGVKESPVKQMQDEMLDKK